MSKVYITASIEAETNILEKDIEKYVREKLGEGPAISGNGKAAEIFVNKISGCNRVDAINCSECLYKETLRKGPADAGGGVICDAPEGFKCPTENFQTIVIITINGEIDGKTRKEVLRDYRMLINYLKRTRNGCGFTILHKSCHIMGIA